MEYNTELIINGKTVKLSKEEQSKVKKWNESRLAFAILDENTIAVNDSGERETRTFLKEDYGIDDAVFETLIRGYIRENIVVFYRSGKFSPVGFIPGFALKLVAGTCREKFGRKISYDVFDGLKVGKPGEDWTPLSKWGIIQT